MTKPHSNNSGFTLLEVQVAVAVLLVSIGSTGMVVASNLRQLTWLETRTQHTVLVPAANTSVIFTVIHSTPIPDNSRNSVNVLELSSVPPDLTAQVQLTDR